MIKIVADTFREAVLSKASDIHIEPQQNSLRIRFRNEGDLHQVASLAARACAADRFAREGHFKFEDRREHASRRTAASARRSLTATSISASRPSRRRSARRWRIRVLDPATGLKDFENLPLRYGNLEASRRGSRSRSAWCSSPGPPVPGKRPHSMLFLQKLNKEDVNIVTLEDPVEYFVAGVNQSQVHPEIGYDFASGLRQILRQDPDVVMVGEIRDNETAGLAVQAALTGHIVLSTLHTNNAAGVIPRLIDMKVEPFLLPVSAQSDDGAAPDRADLSRLQVPGRRRRRNSRS